MNNNTQIETAVLAGARLRFVIGSKVSDVRSFVKGSEWQKQQDEAKYNSLSVDELLLEREKIEKLIRSKDEMALVNYELKQLGIDELPKSYITDLEYKYKELLDSHNELLELLRNSRPLMQPIEYFKGYDYLILDGRIENAINKAKNIKQ